MRCARASPGSTAGAGITSFPTSRPSARTATRCCPSARRSTMTQPFLKAYSDLLIHTCHRRGAHAMGGMAAQIPISGDAGANAAALRTRARRQAARGRRPATTAPGSRIPALVPIARDVFDGYLPTQHQHRVPRDDVHVARDDLLAAAARQHQPRRLRQQRRSLRALSRGMARRPGLRADPLADGRRGDRRDRARAVVAMAALPAGLHLDDGTPIDFALFERALIGLPARSRRSSRCPARRRSTTRIALLDALTHRRRRSTNSSRCPPTTLID